MLWVVLGLGAGVLTTVTGVGGGTVLLLGLTVAADPLSALVVTAPALLVGNLHRLWMYRRVVRVDVVGPLLGGAVPGSLLGGLVAVGLPDGFLRGIMGLMAVLVLLREAGWSPQVPRSALAPLGVLLGGLQATGGGSGPVAATLLQALGLSGTGYVASSAAVAAAMHASRLLAYGLGGAVSGDRVAQGLLLAAGITLGNLWGERLERHLSGGTQTRLQRGALLLTLLLAMASVGFGV